MMPDGMSNSVIEQGKKEKKSPIFGLLIIVVFSLILLSMFGEGAIDEKLEFYKTFLGQVLMFMLCTLPILILMSIVRRDDFNFKVFPFLVIGVVSIQTLVLTYLPMLIAID